MIPRALRGRSFSFPLNPAPGYIDASIYLLERHIPFDVGSVAFGALRDMAMSLSISGVLNFEASDMRHYSNMDLTIEADLALPLTAGQITMLAENAIAATAAGSVRDLGRVMAVLARDRQCRERMQELRDEAGRILQMRAGSGY